MQWSSRSIRRWLQRVAEEEEAEQGLERRAEGRSSLLESCQCSGEASERLRSGGTTPAELWELVGEDDPAAELET